MNFYTTLASWCVVMAACSSGVCADKTECTFGKDTMEFPQEFSPPDPDLQEWLARKWHMFYSAEIPEHFSENLHKLILAGREKAIMRREKVGDAFPYRDAVELANPLKFGSMIRENGVYGGLGWNHIGYFLRDIETADQFRFLIAQLHDFGGDLVVMEADRLGPLLQRIKAEGQSLQLKIVRDDFESDLLAKGCFRENGIWFWNFVRLENTSIIEYKYAMNEGHHIARIRRPPGRRPRWSGRLSQPTPTTAP